MLLSNLKRKCSHPQVLSLHLLWRNFKLENAASEWEFSATQVIIISLNCLSSRVFKALHDNSIVHVQRRQNMELSWFTRSSPVSGIKSLLSRLQDATQQCQDTKHLFMGLYLKDQAHLDILVIKCQYRTHRGWGHCAAFSAKSYCTRGKKYIGWEKKHYAWKLFHPSYTK